MVIRPCYQFPLNSFQELWLSAAPLPLPPLLLPPSLSPSTSPQIIPVSYLDEGHVLLEPKDLGHSLTRKLDECSKLSLLRSLSILELALVVAMNHISQLQDYEPFNFETVYKGIYDRMEPLAMQ